MNAFDRGSLVSFDVLYRRGTGSKMDGRPKFCIKRAWRRRRLSSKACITSPRGTGARSAFSVLRAGKVAAGPDYGVERSAYPGQDVLYCLCGAGSVKTLGQRLDVQAGQLVWIANEEPHAHMPTRASPWTLLWFRLDGPNPTALRKRLFGDRRAAGLDAQETRS